MVWPLPCFGLLVTEPFRHAANSSRGFPLLSRPSEYRFHLGLETLDWSFIQGQPLQSYISKLALTDRNMQARFGLKVVLEF